MDATFIRSRAGGPGAGLTRHGKGRVLQVITDWGSAPLAYSLGPAGPSEGSRVIDTLEGQLGPVGPSCLVMDRTYRARSLHEQFDEREIASYAPGLKTDREPNGSDQRLARYYRARWRIERFFAWFAGYRRVATCWEQNPTNHRMWVELALAHILLRRF